MKRILSALLSLALLLGSRGRLRLGLGSRLGRLGLLGGKHLLQGINRMLLGHVVEYRVQLLIAENLGIGLGFVIIPGDDVGDLLRGDPKVRRDFLQSILHKTHTATHLHNRKPKEPFRFLFHKAIPKPGTPLTTFQIDN